MHCNANAVPALEVSVIDDEETPICDVTIQIRDGQYVEKKTLDSKHCVFSGAVERAGSYTLMVSRSQRVLATGQVDVLKGGCHPLSQSIAVRVDQ